MRGSPWIFSRGFLLVCSILWTRCTLAHAQTQTPVTKDAALTQLPLGSRYIERQFRMLIPGSAPGGLDVLEVYVNTPGRHPLALLTHGTSDKPEERQQVYSWSMLPQALWFARHGYVALVIVRRGYGLSGGQQDNINGGCRQGSYSDTGDASASDLRAAVDFAGKNLPEADIGTIVSAGVSTGGFAQVALAAHPSAGLKAGINFAGGRGGNGKGDLCNEQALIAAFHDFGKHARIPMLWIYAENDHWFPPRYAQEFRTAFEKGGATDQFVLAPPDGQDGHHLYNHVIAWAPTVEAFLHEHGLLPIEAPYVEPVPPPLTPPSDLEGHALDAFHAYLLGGPHKAFASDGHGHYGMALGQIDQQVANQHALSRCEKPTGEPVRQCRIFESKTTSPAQD